MICLAGLSEISASLSSTSRQGPSPKEPSPSLLFFSQIAAQKTTRFSSYSGTYNPHDCPCITQPLRAPSFSLRIVRYRCQIESAALIEVMVLPDDPGLFEDHLLPGNIDNVVKKIGSESLERQPDEKVIGHSQRNKITQLRN